jgi:hypothetical protein
MLAFTPQRLPPAKLGSSLVVISWISGETRPSGMQLRTTGSLERVTDRLSMR